jgi:hypothetical protein
MESHGYTASLRLRRKGALSSIHALDAATASGMAFCAFLPGRLFGGFSGAALAKPEAVENQEGRGLLRNRMKKPLFSR